MSGITSDNPVLKKLQEQVNQGSSVDKYLEMRNQFDPISLAIDLFNQGYGEAEVKSMIQYKTATMFDAEKKKRVE